MRARLVCVRQADTWTWPDHLGTKTPGKCAACGSPIFYEAQNAPIELKVCAQCATPRPSVVAILRRIWRPYVIVVAVLVGAAVLLVLADAIWEALR